MYVEWIDSTMRKSVWSSAENLLNDTMTVQDRFQTIAYLVNQNKLEYIFSGSLHFDGDNDVVSFGQVFTIPKGCVTKLIKLKILSKHSNKK